MSHKGNDDGTQNQPWLRALRPRAASRPTAPMPVSARGRAQPGARRSARPMRRVTALPQRRNRTRRVSSAWRLWPRALAAPAPSPLVHQPAMAAATAELALRDVEAAERAVLCPCFKPVLRVGERAHCWTRRRGLPPRPNWAGLSATSDGPFRRSARPSWRWRRP